jgi:hypothetical protein
MAKTNLTVPTAQNAEQYLAAIPDAARRADCTALAKLLAQITGEPATMWGTAIVGFGTHHYRYASGREGDMCVVGFSSRKGDISIYGLDSAPAQSDLLAKLGRHKMGKSCLYVAELAHLDLAVFEQLVRAEMAAKR